MLRRYLRCISIGSRCSGQKLSLIPCRGFNDEIKVSESDPVSATDITDFLTTNEISFQKGHACIKTTCPRFTRPKLKLDKLDQLYVNSTTGYFVCLSCKRSGPWKNLRDNINTLLHPRSGKDKAKKLPACFKNWSEDPDSSHREEISKLLSECMTEPLENSQFENLAQLLKMKGITQKTFTQYQVKVFLDGSGIILPCFNIDLNHQSAKILTLTENNRLRTRTLPRDDYGGLFGWSVAKNRKTIVLTSSEADAMAVYQETGIAAIALPRGISNLPQQALPFLESFEKITIWFDNTVQAFENAKSFAGKLGLQRTAVIRPDVHSPSPMKALERGDDFNAILSRSISLLHEHVIKFSKFRDAVRHELEFATSVAGIKWNNFPKLTELLKGHRRGELTIFTGGTGSGKTTFLSDYSLDLCTSGVNTLWGSFEITNIRLMKLMLQQYARKDLAKKHVRI